MIAKGRAAVLKRRTFVFVNNRLEGDAISTTSALLEPPVDAHPHLTATAGGRNAWDNSSIADR